MKLTCPLCRQVIPSEDWGRHQQWHVDVLKPRGSARASGVPRQSLRERWAPLVAMGHVVCGRYPNCLLQHSRPEGPLILPGEEWELGHVAGDKTRYSGPEHHQCSSATARHQARQVVA
jgi:hypothetical protein